MGEEPEQQPPQPPERVPQPPERVAQEQHVLPPQHAPERSQAPAPQEPEHGYWSVPSDDSGEQEPQTASAAVAIAWSESSEPDDPWAVPMPRSARPPTTALGWVALSLAAACVIADVVAVVLATQRYWVSATLIAEGTNVATVIVFVVGLFAAWRKPARWLGIIAMAVAILANPFILSHLLAFLGG